MLRSSVFGQQQNLAGDEFDGDDAMNEPPTGARPARDRRARASDAAEAATPTALRPTADEAAAVESIIEDMRTVGLIRTQLELAVVALAVAYREKAAWLDGLTVDERCRLYGLPRERWNSLQKNWIVDADRRRLEQIAAYRALPAEARTAWRPATLTKKQQLAASASRGQAGGRSAFVWIRRSEQGAVRQGLCRVRRRRVVHTRRVRPRGASDPECGVPGPGHRYGLS